MEEVMTYDTQAVTIQQNEDEIRIRLQNFSKLLNRTPKANEVRTNKYAGNSKYLPISFLEMNLDEMFFGLWQTKNFTSKVIGNEICGEIELWYFHPTAKTWLTRVGSAAVMIQFKSGSDLGDVRNKITNTLGKDYPHLKAQCFRNACLSLGKAFGRDLNREYFDEYEPLIKEPINNEALRDFLADYIDPLTKEELKSEAVRIIDVAKKTMNSSEINELKNIIKERVK